ncbi:DUF2971 domain-containing protein [Winogradskyella sp. SYSU M77433]|uniref:DUF2971 domain-containing protein n=1 Tax=Winogradskyella sp. SYSU M77433 TaxID=3042722 RepID=UPI002480EA4F|nr:DUF2971 domain-containing protein [Winogradskyella sp. SYSU M77433]MDH7911768.1 hypothetical protein [Winogradskyella sp. SYSU M77433]
MIPNYLYHYTSLDILKIILETKTIRFKRIDLMNDPFEGKLGHFKNLKKLVFSTSWTAEKRDELPMWKMYSDLKGVRIKMPIDLFNTNESMKVAKLGGGENYLIESELDKEYTIETVGLNLKQKQGLAKINRVSKAFGPTAVEYYDNELDLIKGLVNLKESDKTKTYPNNFYEINLNQVGQRKIDFWKFEKEYRYRLFFGNTIMVAGSKDTLNDQLHESLIKTEYIDINFKKDSLENLEILLGPNVDAIKEQECKKMLESMNISNFKLTKSKIKVN